jgi:hypothetical protein
MLPSSGRRGTPTRPSLFGVLREARFTGLSSFVSVPHNPEPPAEGNGSAKRRTYEGGLIVRSNFVSLFWIR